MSPSPNPLVTLANMYGIIIPTNSAVMYVLASGDIKNIPPWIIIPLSIVISYMYVVW